MSPVAGHLAPTDVARMLHAHGVHPSRALGQNFLGDANTARKIVRLAGVGVGDQVVEIGPGLGALTVALVATGAKITAVELDRHLVAVLRETVEPLGARIVHGDALRVRWADLLGDGASQVVVGNLPYNMAVPIVLRVLDEAPSVARLLVMVQREVADRLVAWPGSKSYGAVTVHVAYWAEAAMVGRVAPSVFVPRPNVESALVSLVRRPEPAVDPSTVSLARLMAVVRAGFAQRRKMLRSALAGMVDDQAYVAAEVSPTARAETLDVAAWGRLAAWTTQPVP